CVRDEYGSGFFNW
nr:immunoglobulin heavy chain junction region [Macaca mulatta]